MMQGGYWDGWKNRVSSEGRRRTVKSKTFSVSRFTPGKSREIEERGAGSRYSSRICTVVDVITIVSVRYSNVKPEFSPEWGSLTGEGAEMADDYETIVLGWMIHEIVKVQRESTLKAGRCLRCSADGRSRAAV